MERDTYRDDDYRESKVYVETCGECHWEDDESHGSEEECTREACPECGSDHIVIETDWV